MEGLFEMLANGTEYEDEVEIVDQPAQEVRRAYASVLATWLYGEESKQAHRREIDALSARAEQAEAAVARVRKLATRWAILRTYGGAAYELRKALDEKPAETTPLVHQSTKPQASHSAGADEPALDEQQPTCRCGESTDPRVVHRADSPCHMDEQPTT